MHYVYILRGAARSLYVGETSDLEFRLMKHQEGSACAFTAKRRPVSLVYSEAPPRATMRSTANDS